MNLFENILNIPSENLLFLMLFLIIVAYLTYKNLELKQIAYFAKRSKECYNQMLYATVDGYFAFFYPDENIKTKEEAITQLCSRRLAVLLNLSNGTHSKIEDVLSTFSTTNIKEINKLLNTLKESGISFQKEFDTKKGKKILMWGNKISDIEGSVFCDVIWFRDLSFSNAKQSFLETSIKQINQKNIALENLFNTTPFPMWVRDEKLSIIYKNKEYQNICQEQDLLKMTSDSSMQNLSLKASSSKKAKTVISSIIINGKKQYFNFIESPIITDLAQEQTATCGVAINATHLVNLEKKLEENQSKQLEVFTTLNTAFAIFDENKNLCFCNDSFLKTFKLEKLWAASKPTYQQFLDILRENKIIKETSIYKAYKADELLAFETISTPKEDMIFLTDEKTLKRLRAPYHQGGLIFAFEDISSQITKQNIDNSLLSMQKDILNNIFDAVVVFSPDGKLSFYNNAFISMWQQQEAFLQTLPTINDFIEAQKNMFSTIKDWESLKKEFLEHIFNPATKVFTANTDTNSIDISSKTLIDGSIIIIYRQH